MRYRHDGFTGPKRRRFLKVLAKTGCIADAARVAGISTTTVDRWRAKEPRFERACVNAIDMASSHIETLAWERAVTGIEEPVIHYGKLIGTRVKRSDSIFRMLLMASNRGKYGRMGAVKRKEIEKEIEKELRRKMAAEAIERHDRNFDSGIERLSKTLDNMRCAKIAEGWTEAPDRSLIPPGWGPVTEEAKAEAAEAARRAAEEAWE